MGLFFKKASAAECGGFSLKQPDCFQSSVGFDTVKGDEVWLNQNQSVNNLAGSFNFIIILLTIILIVGIIITLLRGALLKGTSDLILDTKRGTEMIKNAGEVLIFFILTYSVLYFINPDLTKFSLIITSIKDPTESTTATLPGSSVGFSGCKVYKDIFLKASDGNEDLKNLLMAIGTRESSGCTLGLTSSAGAVGIMQIMPNTAKDLGCGNTTDPEAAIDCAVLVLKQNQKILVAKNFHGGTGYALLNKNRCIVNTDQCYDEGNAALIASYNAGAGSTPGSGTGGKNPGFSDSKDCPGYYAWECPIKAGGLEQTQKYVKEVQNYIITKPWEN